MKLGKVIGSVVCTQKDPAWEGVKLLLIQPLDPEGHEDGAPLAAILHHTCHPCHGYPQRWVHPDWPGAWAEAAGEAAKAAEAAPLPILYPNASITSLARYRASKDSGI